MSGLGSREVVIVRTSVANTASVVAAFERIGLGVRLSQRADELAGADLLVLPGVGSFGSGVARLDELGLRDVIRQRIERQRPLLGICLGMQLLFAGSDESPGAPGLGVFKERVGRFVGPRRVPQLGWNTIEPSVGCRVIRAGSVYYANSYRVSRAPAGWDAACSDYAGSFVGAIEKGPVVLCQFHPELSGGCGAGLLSRWVEVARESEARPC